MDLQADLLRHDSQLSLSQYSNLCTANSSWEAAPAAPAPAFSCTVRTLNPPDSQVSHADHVTSIIDPRTGLLWNRHPLHSVDDLKAHMAVAAARAARQQAKADNTLLGCASSPGNRSSMLATASAPPLRHAAREQDTLSLPLSAEHRVHPVAGGTQGMGRRTSLQASSLIQGGLSRLLRTASCVAATPGVLFPPRSDSEPLREHPQESFDARESPENRQAASGTTARGAPVGVAYTQAPIAAAAASGRIFQGVSAVSQSPEPLFTQPEQPEQGGVVPARHGGVLQPPGQCAHAADPCHPRVSLGARSPSMRGPVPASENVLWTAPVRSRSTAATITPSLLQARARLLLGSLTTAPLPPALLAQHSRIEAATTSGQGARGRVSEPGEGAVQTSTTGGVLPALLLPVWRARRSYTKQRSLQRLLLQQPLSQQPPMQPPMQPLMQQRGVQQPFQQAHGAVLPGLSAAARQWPDHAPDLLVSTPSPNHYEETSAADEAQPSGLLSPRPYAAWFNPIAGSRVGHDWHTAQPSHGSSSRPPVLLRQCKSAGEERGATAEGQGVTGEALLVNGSNGWLAHFDAWGAPQQQAPPCPCPTDGALRYQLVTEKAQASLDLGFWQQAHAHAAAPCEAHPAEGQGSAQVDWVAGVQRLLLQSLSLGGHWDPHTGPHSPPLPNPNRLAAWAPTTPGALPPVPCNEPSCSFPRTSTTQTQRSFSGPSSDASPGWNYAGLPPMLPPAPSVSVHRELHYPGSQHHLSQESTAEDGGAVGDSASTALAVGCSYAKWLGAEVNLLVDAWVYSTFSCIDGVLSVAVGDDVGPRPSVERM